jgi:hypothetical protein
MAKYVAGRGRGMLDTAAVERLRERKEQSKLPSAAEDEQASKLLGGGARKIARCNECTRPMCEGDTGLICSRCRPDCGKISLPPGLQQRVADKPKTLPRTDVEVPVAAASPSVAPSAPPNDTEAAPSEPPPRVTGSKRAINSAPLGAASHKRTRETTAAAAPSSETASEKDEAAKKRRAERFGLPYKRGGDEAS